MRPAIVVVAYNRPNSLRRLLSSIAKANYRSNDIPLIISIDKADIEQEIVAISESFDWEHGPKTIRTFDCRQGLRKHVIQCGDLSNEYGAVIILEDDLFVSSNYYSFVEDALCYYEDSSEITGISLYSHEWNGFGSAAFQPIADKYDTYLGQFSISWGQCWTQKWWNDFKKWYLVHEGSLADNDDIPDAINHWSDHSWGKYYANYIVEENKFYVMPRISLSTNFTEIGQHAKKSSADYQVRIMNSPDVVYRFAPVDKAMKYDIFFENMALNQFFDSSIASEGITVDLYGIGRKNQKNRYILSSECLPYKAVKGFALQLRPMDANVVYQLNGNDIHLYDTHAPCNREKSSRWQLLRYEFREVSNRSVLEYAFFVFRDVIKRKLLHR